MSDVFAPPESETAAPAAADPEAVPAYQLFSSGQVAGATFLGTPLAGAVLVGLNAQRLGRPVARPVGLGVGLAVATFVLAVVLPEWMPGFPIAIAGVLAMHRIAESEFGSAVFDHAERGGAMAPWWQAIGIGLAALIVAVVVFGIVLFGVVVATGDVP